MCHVFRTNVFYVYNDFNLHKLLYLLLILYYLTFKIMIHNAFCIAHDAEILALIVRRAKENVRISSAVT